MLPDFLADHLSSKKPDEALLYSVRVAKHYPASEDFDPDCWVVLTASGTEQIDVFKHPPALEELKQVVGYDLSLDDPEYWPVRVVPAFTVMQTVSLHFTRRAAQEWVEARRFRLESPEIYPEDLQDQHLLARTLRWLHEEAQK